MKAVVISVGDELLSGRTLNTNLRTIAEFLARFGIPVVRNCTVRDDVEEIIKITREALESADIVIVSGGLGITVDDVTRGAIARAMGVELVFDEDFYKEVEKRMLERGVKVTEEHKKYGLVPAGFELIKNDYGLAPGYFYKKDGKILLVLPGPPHELRNVLENASKKFEGLTKKKVLVKTVKTFGLKESDIVERIKDVIEELKPIGSYPIIPGMVDLRLTLVGEDEEKLKKEMEKKLDILRERLGDAIYGFDDDTLPGVIGKILRSRGMTISTAESCTGGLVANYITDVSGSSDYFKGGVVSYWNEVKSGVLGVSDVILEHFGAVSEPTAVMMAEGVRKLLGTDVGISTTGIAGPTGGTPEKPVGLVFMGVSIHGKTFVLKKIFKGDRLMVKKQAALNLIDFLRRKLGEVQ